MRIIRDIDSLADSDTGCVIALGNFDGVHLGHQAIMRECVEKGAALDAPAAVLTFAPHPREYFAKREGKKIDPLHMYGLTHKSDLLDNEGIDTVFLLRFNAALADMSAEQFITGVLVKALRVKHVVTGMNFAFGKGRSGNADTLQAASAAHGFGYSKVGAVTIDDTVVSSSGIRGALEQGDVRKAALLLGKYYSIRGRVGHGDKRGAGLGFPTANIALPNICTPRYGVYAVNVNIDGAWHGGVCNLGIRPTFGGQVPRLEVHLLDHKQDLYGKKITVEFVSFIRNEQRFPTPNALSAQIAKDTAQARSALRVSLQ